VFGDSIEILEKTVKVVWEYSDIQQVKRLRNTYLLMKDKNMGIAIDPETFTEGNFYNFKRFLREKCPNIQIPE
ncbi:MAG: YcxB family protein, partial [Oscillospiraceae bacterium]|nr:YcxB family protein [Oscillospiraceae bacterium]